jgi:alkylated DNA repair dioxygenase AlkB
MKVKAKQSNRFLTKDEWYEVVNKLDVDNGGYPHSEEFKEVTPGRSIHYELVNHTNKKWTTSWYHECNFHTIQEIRDMKIKELGIMIDGTLYIDNFIQNDMYLFDTLRSTASWDHRMASRLTTSFGVSYDYSGISYPHVDMPDYLNPLINSINDLLGFTPNNCLINYYLDGSSKMGYHSDRTDILSPGTGVVIISLGSTRTLRFRNNDTGEIVDFPLNTGSLFYMNSDVQTLWKHSIPSEDSTNSRMSLTFRNLFNSQNV